MVRREVCIQRRCHGMELKMLLTVDKGFFLSDCPQALRVSLVTFNNIRRHYAGD